MEIKIMNLLGLTKLLANEELTAEYLQRKGILRTFDHCIHCESKEILRVRRGHIKCYSCKREWSGKKFSIIEDIHISPQKFLLAVKCFSLKLTTSVSAIECGVSENTIIKLFAMFRDRLSDISNIDILEQQVIQIFIIAGGGNSKFMLQINGGDRHPTLATLSLRRIRRKDSGYSYCIENHQILKTTSKTTMSKVSNIIKEFGSQLEKLNARSTKELVRVAGEAVFRFSHKNEYIFEKMLMKIGG